MRLLNRHARGVDNHPDQVFAADPLILAEFHRQSKQRRTGRGISHFAENCPRMDTFGGSIRRTKLHFVPDGLETHPTSTALEGHRTAYSALTTSISNCPITFTTGRKVL